MSMVQAGACFGMRHRCHTIIQSALVQGYNYTLTRRLISDHTPSMASVRSFTLNKTFSMNNRRNLGTEAGAASSVKSISSEALRVMNLANESKISQDAEMAGQTLLNLTFPPDSMSSNSLQTQKDLHRSFLVVTSLCLAHPSQIELGLELTRRAQQLNMPFHLPLYQKLVSAIAIHHDNSTGQLILEVSSWACVALNTSLQASFFADAMVALVQRDLFRVALDLKLALKSRHGIQRLEVATSIRMLLQLKANLQMSSSTVIDTVDAMNLALDLKKALMHDIRDYEQKLTESDDNKARMAMMNDNEPHEMRKIMDALENNSEDEDDDVYQSDLDDDDDEDVDDNEDDEDEYDYDLSDSLKSAITEIVNEVKVQTRFNEVHPVNGIKNIQGRGGCIDDDNDPNMSKISENNGNRCHGDYAVSNENRSVSGLMDRLEYNAISDRVKKIVGPNEYRNLRLEKKENQDGETDDEDDSDYYDTDDDDGDTIKSTSYHDAMANSLLYLRDASSWILPDVTIHVTELNGGRELLYTSMFEEQLLYALEDEYDDEFSL